MTTPRPMGQALLDAWDNARAAGVTMRELAEQYGIARKSLETAIWKERVRAKRRAERAAMGVPERPELFDVVNLGTPWTLTGDWVICGDVHTPCTNWDMVLHVAELAEKRLKKPRRLLIAGDFFNMDAFSNYAAIVALPGWKEEREAARHLLKLWRETFDEIRFLTGNHERRLAKWMQGQFDDEDLRSLLQSDGVQVSNFGWCWLDTDNGRYRITHPKNYSINRLIVANDLAQKFDAHIIGFHEHHLGISWDRYGRHLIVNGGCLVDPHKLAYVEMDDNKGAAMVAGFVLVAGGYPYLFGDDQFTDWQRWLK